MRVRGYIAAALVVLAAQGANAQQPSVTDQFSAAVASFMGGIGDAAQFHEGYRKHVLAGLGGTWTEMSTQFPDHAENCERMRFEIETPSPYEFLVKRLGSKGDAAFVATYTSMGANLFGEHVNPKDYLHWLGLDRIDAEPEGPRVVMSLAQVNGLATVHRPSPDILVIQTNYQLVRIFGRCP